MAIKCIYYTDQSRMLIFTPDHRNTRSDMEDSNWKDSSDGDEGYAVVRSKEASAMSQPSTSEEYPDGLRLVYRSEPDRDP